MADVLFLFHYISDKHTKHRISLISRSWKPVLIFWINGLRSTITLNHQHITLTPQLQYFKLLY